MASNGMAFVVMCGRGFTFAAKEHARLPVLCRVFHDDCTVAANFIDGSG
jgi:hypothetical protein